MTKSPTKHYQHFKQYQFGDTMLQVGKMYKSKTYGHLAIITDIRIVTFKKVTKYLVQYDILSHEEPYDISLSLFTKLYREMSDAECLSAGV